MHREHSVLHPKTTYSRAIAKIVDAWLDVFPALDSLSAQMRFDRPTDSAVTLEQRYVRLLHSLNEHFDACYAIIRCLNSPLTNKREWHEHASRRQRPAGLKSFEEQAVHGYRKVRLGRIVNLLKHDHARLSLLSMRTSLLGGSSLTLGYFVDGGLPSGAIGPAPGVHRGSNSAFSFNRDMLLNWWWLYRTSELLAQVIDLGTDAQPTEGAEANRNNAIHDEANPKLMELCRRIAALRLDFMPDEVTQPFPVVQVPADASFMRITFPAGRRANPILGEPRFTQFLTVDSVGQSFKMPYFGADADEAVVEVK